jgi:GNAT superfamily N-acetyltransferase
MSSHSGFAPLSYRRIGRADLNVILGLELDPAQIEQFLGPLADILATVRRGLAHLLVGIEAEDALVGFYVLHPDRRDRSCWWLGWFAIDRRAQGRGYGTKAMQHIMSRIRHIAGCRRVRLLVAAENAGARRLYERTGFQPAAVLPETGELILECELPDGAPTLPTGALICLVSEARRVFQHVRLRQTVGPYAAPVIGVERGPPPASLRRQDQRGQRLSAGTHARLAGWDREGRGCRSGAPRQKAVALRHRRRGAPPGTHEAASR